MELKHSVLMKIFLLIYPEICKISINILSFYSFQTNQQSYLLKGSCYNAHEKSLCFSPPICTYLPKRMTVLVLLKMKVIFLDILSLITHKCQHLTEIRLGVYYYSVNASVYSYRVTVYS